MAKESIILTGFMGMGKSTVGPKAADVLGMDYYDTDGWMETESGIDVPALVKSDIIAFRRLEAETLATILDQKPGVISTGGGIVSTEIGRQALWAAQAAIVWLNAPFEEAAKRVQQDTGRERPLFSDIDVARALYQERQQWYAESAGYIVNAAQPVELVVGDIVKIARAT